MGEAADLNVEISGEDKDWFKEHVTKRVQARAEPDEEEEDPRHPLISEDMSAVVGVSRANHFRLVKLLWKYIKANNLQNPSNRNEILCDDLEDIDTIECYNKIIKKINHQ